MDVRIAVLAEHHDQGVQLTETLRSAQWEVMVWPLANASYASVRAWKPTLLVCDCERPMAATRKLLVYFSRALHTPVMVLLQAATEQDVIDVLRQGADDCVLKPLGTEELLARTEALLRRYHAWNELEPLSCRPFVEIDGISRTVMVGDDTISLTPTECRLLSYLVQRDGGVATRDELCAQIWGLDGNEKRDATLNLHIHGLRKKLEQDPRHPTVIRTKWKVGYYLANLSRRS
jgi:two-component system OmpR family response regulator